MEIDTKQRKLLSLELAQQGLEIIDLDLYNIYRKKEILNKLADYLFMFVGGMLFALLIVFINTL